MRSFPHSEAMIPQLPRKSVVSRFRPKFLEQRKAGLSHFLKYVALFETTYDIFSARTSLLINSSCILLNPEFAASPILKDFIFA